jgi:hypothetical protein
MVVNFKTREISRDARKLARIYIYNLTTSTLSELMYIVFIEFLV